jgi:hypothetical protein
MKLPRGIRSPPPLPLYFVANWPQEMSSHAHFHDQIRNGAEKGTNMRMIDRVKERAATGYILLWLLGIPIPILLLIFLLRGCT